MKCPVLSCIGLLLLLVVGVIVGVRDPYTTIYASSAEVKQGATLDDYRLKDIETGDYVGFKQLNFSGETVAFEWVFINTAGYDPNHKLSLRLDSPTASPFLYYHILPTGGGGVQSTALISFVNRPRGVHDLYFTFQHPGGLGFNSFRFMSMEELLPPSTTLCPHATTAIDSPTPQPTTCPPPIDCPLAEPSVHPSEPRSHVSVEQCDNDTLTHNHINIYIN